MVFEAYDLFKFTADIRFIAKAILSPNLQLLSLSDLHPDTLSSFSLLSKTFLLTIIFNLNDQPTKS